MLDALEHDALRPCVPLALAGPQNLAPEVTHVIHGAEPWTRVSLLVQLALSQPNALTCFVLRLERPLRGKLLHVLPQWAFLALLPSGSAVHLREVADVAPT